MKPVLNLWSRWLPIVVIVALIDTTPVLAKDIPSAVRAQSDDEISDDEDEEVEEVPDRFRRASSQTTNVATASRNTTSSDGPGIIGQLGHLGLKTFGRNQSISPIEAMPYVLTDEHFIFSDLRGFVSNDSMFGGNFGLGYRHLREDLNAWYGASFWYDVDGTSGKNFQQVGLSLEGLISRWEFRSNIYLPVSSSQTYSTTLGNERIVGHQLLYTRYIDHGKALQGVDFETGYSLPIQDRHWLRGFVGYYHFNGGPGGAVNGFKTRVEGVINNAVTAQVLYTNDRLFGNNVMVGCSVLLPWGGSHPTSNWKQNTPSPFRFVQRNYNVIVDRGIAVEDNLIAINPLTHTAYNIQQVSSGAAPGGNGTFANPFQTVAQAQGAGGDVILVQGNSVLNAAVTLAPGQQLLGDGSNQPLQLDGGGTVHLPTQILGGATPRFDGASSAITLANNSVFGGFTIANNGGNAIIGNNVSGVTVRDVLFQNIGGDAVRLTNSSGNVTLENLTVNTAVGNGISVIGGTPNLTLSGSISGTQGDGIFLSNLTGGSVNIFDTSIQTTGGAGLRMSNVAANATIDSLTTTATTGTAIDITGGTAANSYHFTHSTTVNQPGSTSFNVNNASAAVTVDNLIATSTVATPAVSLNNSTGKITFGNLDIDSTNGVALFGRDLTSLKIARGSLTSVGAGAVDIEDSTIDVTLDQVSVDGGPFGIRLVQNTGIFQIAGNNAYASGGTIKNTTTGVILTSTGTATLNWLDLTDNGTGIQSSGNDFVTFNVMRISGSTGYALDAQNDDGLILKNSILANNGAVGGGTIRAQATVTGNYQWLIQQNLISDHNGTPILLQTQAAANGSSLGTTIDHNTITSDRSGVTLVSINWNGPLSVMVSKNVLNAAANNMTGVSVVGTSVTDAVNARITSNAMTFTGSMGTGALVAAAAGSSLQVDANSVDFEGVSGTGLRFNLAGVSTAWIYSNTITDNAGTGTGMLFDTVAANSRVQIEANNIKLMSGDLTPHRGIIFTTVTPTIQLFGNYNNVITNASQVFSMPVNSATGKIIINGALFP